MAEVTPQHLLFATQLLLHINSSQTHLPAVLAGRTTTSHGQEPCGPARALLVNADACPISHVLQQ